MSTAIPPWVGIVMGSASDLEVVNATRELLESFQVPYEVSIISAHRTPERMVEYATTAESRGLEVIIAVAGAAAALPGMLAALTVVPVLGVPVPAGPLNGVDALLSMVQMPRGVAVGTLGLGRPGASNAALLAVCILALSRPDLRARLRAWRDARRAEAAAQKVL